MSESNGTGPAPALARPAREWIIDQVLPKRVVALLVGPAGVSKTTAALQWLTEINAGRDVFGHRSYQTEIAFVSCDRSEAEHEAHCHALGIDPGIFHFHDQMNFMTSIERVVRTCAGRYPRAKLIFIDGFARLLPDGKINDYATVATFLCECAKWCQEFNVTVLGCLHAGKSRDGAGYSDPRDQVCGSTAWAGFSNLMIVMQKANPKDPEDPLRLVHVLTRAGSGDFSFKMTKSRDPEEGGRLTPFEDVVEEDLLSIVSMWINSQGIRLIPKREIVRYARDTITDMSERTVERWLTREVEAGRVLRPEKGKYQAVTLGANQESTT